MSFGPTQNGKVSSTTAVITESGYLLIVKELILSTKIDLNLIPSSYYLEKKTL